MTLTRHNDLALQYLATVPSGRSAEQAMPLVIVLHGRGSDMNDLAELAALIDSPEGDRFVFPNAPKPLEVYPGMSYGFTWFDGWPPTRSSFATSRDLLLRFIEQLLERYATPDGKVILCGFSQGAMMSLDVGFRTPKPLAAVVAMSGALYEEDPPDFSARRDTPVLIIHGTADDMIPVIAARRTRRVLEERGLAPEYHEFPMGHQVTEESMLVVKRFIDSASQGIAP